MNLFRSEEDARSWSRFDESEGEVMAITDVLGMSAHPFYTERLQDDFYPRQAALFDDLQAGAAESD